MRRTVPAVAAILAAVMVTACSRAPREARATPAARVPVIQAVRGRVTPTSTLGGIIVPFQNVAVQSTLSEPALEVLVREGDHVARGQVLAQLDTRDLQAMLQADLATAQSNGAKAQQTYYQAGLTIAQNSNTVNAAQAALAQANATLAKDSTDLERGTQLIQNGYISQQAYDQLTTVVKNDREAVRAAQVAVQNARAQVQANGTTSSGLQGAGVAAARAEQQVALSQADQIRAQIARATIVSPIDGVVVNRNFNAGEYPGTRQLFTLQETDRVYAVLNGAGGQVIGAVTGGSAQVSSTDNVSLKANGQIVAVLDQVNPGATNFIIKVLLPNPQGAFHAGMVVSGTVRRTTTSGILIPQTAFTDDTHSAVQILSEKQIKTIPVTLLAADGKNAVVTGLRGGEAVVSNGQLGLADGTPARAMRPGDTPPAGRGTRSADGSVAER
jgi:HlyD family secretion protein